MTSMDLVKLNSNNITKDKRNEYAELFAEGNEQLKNILLKLWERGIDTYACCAGHGEPRWPYIFLNIEKFLNSDFESLIAKILTYSKKYNLCFGFSNDYMHGVNFERKGLSISAFQEKISSEKFFTIVHEILFGENEKQEYKFTDQDLELIKSIKKIYEIDMLNYLNISKKNSNCQINTISIWLEADNVILRYFNNMNHKSFKLKDNFNKETRYLLAEGYYKKIKGRYYALKNGEVIEINEDELKNYNLYRNYVKYNKETIFSVEKFNNVLKVFNS